MVAPGDAGVIGLAGEFRTRTGGRRRGISGSFKHLSCCRLAGIWCGALQLLFDSTLDNMKLTKCLASTQDSMLGIRINRRSTVSSRLRGLGNASGAMHA